MDYQKRSHHDVIISQPRFQTTYACLKTTHAARLLKNWVEATDPTKHVFEDLGIAAFLIEVWKDMYKHPATEPPSSGQTEKSQAFQTSSNPPFPGFADLGCGNGILVDILLREGYRGVGLDVRARKTWATFPPSTRSHLLEQILVPQPLFASSLSSDDFHNGIFPRGTFLISNHADELTAWTPLLAALQASPFLAIPCCSHALSGARFRAPPVPYPKPERTARVNGKQQSAYAALVAYTEFLARECGFETVEREELRIGSTRNVGVLGRWDCSVEEDVVEERVRAVLERQGGGEGWVDRAMKLRKGEGKGH
jgi:tRNASer (uridine44-2'-O)-methyltransferase